MQDDSVKALILAEEGLQRIEDVYKPLLDSLRDATDTESARIRGYLENELEAFRAEVARIKALHRAATGHFKK